MRPRALLFHIRGHHIFKKFWSPQIGESLTCKPEFGNVFDTYAVAVVKEEEITSLLAAAILSDGMWSERAPSGFVKILFF